MGKEVAEKVKIAVIPRSEATRNLSYCEHLNQEGSLASVGMTAFMLFSATCKGAGPWPGRTPNANPGLRLRGPAPLRMSA